MLLLIILIFCLNKIDSLSDCTINNSKLDLKIIGGQPSIKMEWPWMGSLQIRYFTSHNCGATLISDQWALTAAHCMRKSSQAIVWKIRFGEHVLNHHEDTERDFNISQVFIHPNYSNITKENDITLLKFTTKVDFIGKDRHLRPICLPLKSQYIPIGAVCMAVGWGRRGNNESVSTILQKVPKQLIAQDACIKSWPGISFPIGEGHICFDSLDEGKGVCNGDSGGPIQCQTSDGEWLQMGIASWTSNPCALKGYPAVFTRVAYYADWIRNIISRN